MSIKQVKILNIKKILNKKGDIFKIIDKKNKNFKKFGEIYFSEIKKKYIKGWNLHKKYYCQITLCYGDITITLKDKNSKIKKIKINLNKPFLIIIPPNIWFSIKSNVQKSMILNVLSGVHDANETLKNEIKK